MTPPARTPLRASFGSAPAPTPVTWPAPASASPLTPPCGTTPSPLGRRHTATDTCRLHCSAVDVAVALDDELAGRRVAVDEIRQQRDPHRDRDADGELLPRRQCRRVATAAVA